MSKGQVEHPQEVSRLPQIIEDLQRIDKYIDSLTTRLFEVKGELIGFPIADEAKNSDVITAAGALGKIENTISSIQSTLDSMERTLIIIENLC